MTDDDLRRDVVAELCWDPRVGSSAIQVSAAGGSSDAVFTAIANTVTTSVTNSTAVSGSRKV